MMVVKPGVHDRIILCDPGKSSGKRSEIPCIGRGFGVLTSKEMPPGKDNQLPYVKVPCPMSGMMFGTMKVDHHFCLATRCKNGTIHIYCLLHLFRGFIKHPQILEMLNAEDRTAQARPV